MHSQKAMHTQFKKSISLLLDNLKLGTCCKVCTIVRAKGCEADVTHLHRSVEHNALDVRATGECTLLDALPLLTIEADRNFVILDVAVGAAILTGKVREAFHGALLACIEVDPVGILRYGY